MLDNARPIFDVLGKCSRYFLIGFLQSETENDGLKLEKQEMAMRLFRSICMKMSCVVVTECSEVIRLQAVPSCRYNSEHDARAELGDEEEDDLLSENCSLFLPRPVFVLVTLFRLFYYLKEGTEILYFFI